MAQAQQATWIVVDGYHFDTAYQRAIKAAGLRLLCVDDYGHADHYVADLVLNQNIYAHAGIYPCREPYTRLCLGLQYALLRREFQPWQAWQRATAQVARTVLVTLGGGDADNVTLKSIHALQQIDLASIEARVVIGGSNPHANQLQATIENQKSKIVKPSIHLVHNASNMPDLMAWADVAISAGGSTCWEMARLGLPNLLLVLAENQQPIAAGLARAGASINLGWHADVSAPQIAAALTDLLTSAEKRVQMTRHGQALVDGRGAERVVQRMAATAIELRPVQSADCRLLWAWANDPGVRAVSFSSAPIAWEPHVRWFQTRLADPHCLFYLAVNEAETPIGQVRLDVEDNAAVISVSLAPEMRGQGYGGEILRIAAATAFATAPVATIHAYIKPDNDASVRAFQKAGFRANGATTIQAQPALHFSLQKEDLQ